MSEGSRPNAGSKLKILITHSEIPKSALEIFKDKYELIYSEGLPYPPRETLLKDIQGVDAVMWFGHIHLDKEMILAAGDQLKMVGIMGTGYDHINVKFLNERGVKVSNTPDILSSAVSDMAVGLAIAVSRNIVKGYKAVLDDKWKVNSPTWMCGPGLEGATVGIIGFGAIGKKIAKRIKAFDSKQVLYHNRKKLNEEEEFGAKYVELDELLRESDFIFLAIPLTPETNHLLNKDKFKIMKSTSILINTARGDVINQNDLVDALNTEEIAGAALDVTSPEPLKPGHPLLAMDNVVVTPHIASATFSARENMAKLAAKNIYNGLNNIPLENPIL